MAINKIKKQFPIFNHYKKLVYLDSASSTQTPTPVLDAMNQYYEQERANIHRGLHHLSAIATKRYEEARVTIAKFLNANPAELIFTSGTTHGLNLLAYTLSKQLKAGDTVVLTRMEHHANLVPWQEMSRRYGFALRFIELNGYELDEESIAKVIDANTKIVSFAHVSNTLGTVNSIETIIAAAKKVNAITIIDAAQAVAHLPLDVKKLDCDWVVFSGHKVYGPTGIGILYGKRERLDTLDPFFFGGDMVKEVTYAHATWNDIPERFEGGTPNIAGAIGLSAAIQFIESIGFGTLQKQEKNVTEYALAQLQNIPGLSIIGPETSENRIGVISFTLDGIHPHDIATILDRHGVAVRAGHHCTMPLMHHLGLTGTTRVSLGLYCTKEDVDILMNAIHDVKKTFTRS